MGAQTTKMPEEPTAAASSPVSEGSPSASGDAAPKPKCKACCACPETKRARDDCIVQHGEENCKDLIEAHRKCMKDMGFNI